VRTPPVEAEQDGSIRIQDLTKVVMLRRRRGLAEERLVPIEAAGNVAYADDRPRAFHPISGPARLSRFPTATSKLIKKTAHLVPPSILARKSLMAIAISSQ